MEEDRFLKMQNSVFNRFFERVSNLVIVNLCMLVACLCGLIVFGIYPASFAAAAYFNDQMEGKEQKVFPTIMRYFKKYFIVGNVLMLLTVPTIVAGFIVLFFTNINSMLFYLLFITWVITIYLVNLYMPAINVMYPKFTIRKKLVFSAVVSCNKWKLTGIFTVVVALWVCFVAMMPQFAMFFLLSTMPWFTTMMIKKKLQPETIVDPNAPIPEEYHEKIDWNRTDENIETIQAYWSRDDFDKLEEESKPIEENKSNE